MRGRALLTVFVVFLVVVALASPGIVSAVSTQRKMLMQASFNPTQTDFGVNVLINGRVFEVTNQSVPNAVISIQVTNPQGTSIHVTIAYTNQLGLFSDSFLLPQNSPAGNYTAYLVADKPGYDTASLSLSFAYFTPDFSVEPSTPALTLQQGASGSVSVTVLSLRNFKQAVNLTAIDIPPGVTVQLSPQTLTPSAISTATVATSLSTPSGNYTITIIGVSGSLSHKASFQLTVSPSPFEPSNLPIIGAAAVVVLVLLIGVMVSRSRSKKRKRRESALEELIREAATDQGYVATARVIARLEELRAMGKVDETTYQRLKKEYEKKLEQSK